MKKKQKKTHSNLQSFFIIIVLGVKLRLAIGG